MDPTSLQRALAEAPDRPVAEAQRPEEELFVFRLGDYPMAVGSKQVREVTRLGLMTVLPRVPTFILGVVGHRGAVLPVVDLLRFLSLGESRVPPQSRMFVGESAGSSVGFIAEGVVGLHRVFATERLAPPTSLNIAREFVTGVIHSKEMGALAVLDLGAVIASTRQKVIAR